MNELTTINNGQVVVSSRQISESFEKEHRHVLETIRNLTAENSTVKSMFFESSYKNERGRDYAEYLMNRDGFSLLVMGFTGQKALEWKLKYIEAFNRMEQLLINRAPSYQITDPIERAKVWIQEQEEKKALEEDIKSLAPAKIFSDAVAGSEDTILVRELATLLKQNGVPTGEKRLFETLRKYGYVIKREGIDKNLPTQKSLELGVMGIREGIRQLPGKEPMLIKTTRITGKGQQYFLNKFLKGEIA